MGSGGDSKRNVSPGMGLGDSACTLLVFPWLGEVVGASLALGKAMGQPLLALGAIVTVIRCSVGAPSECRVSSASLTCGTDISGTRKRIQTDSAFPRYRYRKCVTTEKNVTFTIWVYGY